MSRRSAPVQSTDVVDVTIDRLAEGGRGVARHEGFVLFVNRGLPGDVVRARITRVRRSFAEAIVEEVLTSGPDRVTPPCPFLPECGGCSWQSLDYPAQLVAKQEQVREVLERLGGVSDPQVEPIVPATNLFGYRNKMEYTFATNDDDVVGAGFHMFGRWDMIIMVDPCLIADPRGVSVHKTAVDWANKYGIPVYDRETGKGVLRHLVVRVGFATGEVMVNIVTGPGDLPRAAELIDDLEVNVPGLVSIVHSRNESPAEVAYSDEPPIVLWGRDYFEETVAGNALRVRPSSFLQTNTEMSEVLYEMIAEVGKLRPDDVAYDLYCGIGSISLMLARHVKQVFAVEVVEEAVTCAVENASANGIDNIEFKVGNVRPVLKFAVDQPDPTIVVVDPPRSGLVDKVIRRICERTPERIVYVSCNPATFAGNLHKFREHGYDMTYVRPIDQFPHTPHVELVARLEPIPGWVAPPEPEEPVGKKKPNAKMKPRPRSHELNPET